MRIENSNIADMDTIFKLYKIATAYQISRGEVAWPDIDSRLVETEIHENRQWKMIIDDQIACIWATTFNDPLIWQEKNSDPAIYIHRISTDSNFRGQGLVTKLLAWAKVFAKQNQKKFIRMDTVGENKGLITYYQKCGFRFLGLRHLENVDELPGHYKEAPVSLFEIEL